MTPSKLPELINSEEELDELLSRPSEALIEFQKSFDGDLIILGVGGKLGSSLARMAQRAAQEAGIRRRIIGVSRFTDPEKRRRLEEWGIETVVCDLLSMEEVERLPDVPNVIFMAGTKFGSVGNEPRTWAMNAFVPGIVAHKFQNSRIVAFSTGNVYPLVPVHSGGATEDTPPDPVGEYAQSCLGRERVLQFFSTLNSTPTTIIRLNYAVELRYGVVLDIAKQVWKGEPVDLRMPQVNVIWQGDACDMSLRSFQLCRVPPTILNLTGPEAISVRWLANRFGDLFDRPPRFENREEDTALLSNAAAALERFGYPRVPLARVIKWVAHWVQIDGPTYQKPTHFSEREGRF